MAERLYLGPMSKQLRGDREDAESLERTARAKVGYLFDSMMSDQTFKSGSWNLEGGRKILAFVWRDVLGKRAIVRLTGIGGGDQILIEVALESGLMFHGDNFTVDEELRPRLWVSNRGTAPINGSSDSGSNTLTILNTALPPEAISDGSYISEQWTATDNSMYDGDPVFDPLGDEYDGSYSCASMYTGLMRAAVEAKMGLETKDGTWAERYRYFEILPWGAGTPFVGSVQAYNSTGLVRTSDYTYFAVYITNLECKACRLIPLEDMDGIASNIVQLLRENVLSGQEQDKLESVYLSLLTYEQDETETPIEIDLLSESDVTPEHDPEIAAPIAYGWHFSYPPLAEASIVRMADTWIDTGPSGFKKTARSYLTTVTFTTEQDEDGVWSISASATTSDEGAWTPNWSRVQLWIPKGLHFPWLNNEAKNTDWLSTFSTDNEIDSPVYCFYDKYAGLQLCRLKHNVSEYRHATDEHTPPLADRLATCDAISSIRSTIPAPYVFDVTVGITIGGLDYTYIVTEGNAYQYDQYITTASFNEEYIGSYGGSSDSIKGKCSGGDGVTDEDGWLSKPFKIYMDVGPVTYKETRTDVVPQHESPGGPEDTAHQPLGVALVIPRLNSEAVGVFVRKVPRHTKVGTYETSYNYFYNAARYEFYENNTFATYVGEIKRYYGYSCGATISNYTNFMFTGSKTGAVNLIPEMVPYTNSVVPGNYAWESTLTEAGFDIATLITSSQTIDLPTNDDRWYLYLSPDSWNTSDWIDFQAPESRLGNIIYPRHSTTGEWTLKHRYNSATESFVPGESSTIPLWRCRWVGWE